MNSQYSIIPNFGETKLSMLKMKQTDTYELDPIEIIIRISIDDANVFNQYNEVSIDQLKGELQDLEVECFFQKLAEEKHKIIVPVWDGQVEIVTTLHFSETYQAIVNKKRETIFREKIKYPEKNYIKETVSIRIIDLNERGRATDEFEVLFERVEKLPIVPDINVENQQELWLKWIEAQRAIVDNLQQPFQVKPEYEVLETKNARGEVSRYTLKFDLAINILPEYKKLEEKIKELGIEERFDAEGNIFLTREQIQAFDNVIHREFPESLERNQTISAILKLRPLTLAQKIQRESGIQISQNHHTGQLFVSCKASKEINQLFRTWGFEFKSFRIEFTIINHGNILDNESINKRHSITFGDRFIKSENEKELLLPFPKNNTFVFYNEDYFFVQLFHQGLIRIYGKNNIQTNLKSVYEAISPNDIQFFDKYFTEDFWVELKRKLYAHNLEDAINPYSQSLYLEFTTENELKKQLQVIEKLQLCDIAYSPLKEDFRFKIKTNVIAKKSEKELFLEKIKLLRGAEFVVEVAQKEKKRKEFVYLGKLNANESDIQKLVLNVPNIFKDDKKKAKGVLKFLKAENRPVIREIRANLTGDSAKINWLQTAVKKIADPSESPNGKPVNENLGEFIFDTSKAIPIHDINKVTENTEYYWDVKNNELLQLNESQRKAVLAAIHCRDLALLQGPPGTGKTTVIAEIIWQIIRKNPKHKILLTSETNLAVDNALDRLLKEKSVNSDLAKYTTLIKPLRFGRIGKMDEEGAKYSIDRIMKWSDESYQVPEDIDADILDEQDDEFDEDVQKNNHENNAVQDWMKRIASRAKHNDSKYTDALKEWAMELSFPTKEVKQIFKDKYFQYANVIGSTCSSSGSPGFMWGYAKVFSEDDVEQLKEMNFLAQVAPFGKNLKHRLNNIKIPPEIHYEFSGLIEIYQSDFRVIKKHFNKKEEELTNEDFEKLDELLTVGNSKIRSEKDSKKLISYQNLTDFSRRFVAPFFEPKIQFDTVIMDEASKATPPEMVLPLCFASRCIIIGDHKQLPPMLHEKDFKEALQEANAGHLAEEIDKEFTETSQFEKMILNSGVSSTLISRCNIQYRMHPDINNVIRQFYAEDGGLEPAQELIENANDSDLKNIFSRYHGFYASDFLNVNTHVIWVNVNTPEMREGTSVVNEGEAKAVRTVIELLKKAEGFEEFQKHWDFIKDDFRRKQEKEIAVISFYGAQKRLLRRNLAGVDVPLKINTVDRFQGMERNIVVVSTVRSNEQITFGGKTRPNNDSGFAKSPQRLNVALSRARRLLIVVGNKDFFSNVNDKKGRPLYKNAIIEIERTGKVIDIGTLQKQLEK